MSLVLEVTTGWIRAGIARFRERGWSAIAWIARLTAAAVASFVVASLLFRHSQPLLAPLTALLVVQLTPVSLLASGIDRVLSVVVGVSVAVTFSSLVGVTWWSLATVIAVSLLIGLMLRLGANLLEVPISAMLVLGVGASTADTAAWQRIAETLVGAGVGVLSNLLLPPKVRSRDAAVAIEDLGDDVADLLDTAADDLAADDLSTGDLVQHSTRWLGSARTLSYDIPNVGAALVQAEESRKLNLRAIGTADSGPGLRQGLEALEHSTVAVRSMFRSIADAARDYDTQGRRIDDDVRAGTSLLLHEFADAVRSFGRVVEAEWDPANEPPEFTELRDALAGLHEARARVTDLTLIDPRHDPTFAVLNFALLATVQRLLQELDLGEQTRRKAVRPPVLSRRLVPHPRSDGGGRLRRPGRGRRDS